jgi:2-hydroxychromene-2-carboxylate isomerase
MAARLDFWFEYASTYSYIAAMRIEALARPADVAVAWRPFLLASIFAAQGWNTSPFNIYQAKGRNMWRDMERLAQRFGIPFAKPDAFPQNGLKAARMTLALPDGERRAAFVRAVYDANFARNELIADDATLIRICSELGESFKALSESATTPAIKDALRANTDEAIKAGVFGAPSFVCADGELFWGADRMEMALDHASQID